MRKSRQFTCYVDLRNVQLADGTTETWIDLARLGQYKHPVYGDINFDAATLQQFADNFKNRVRGLDELDIDYDHKQDPAKGRKAAGWLTQVMFDGSVLKGLVRWTKEAIKEIKDGAYRYFSPEYNTVWTDAAGVEHRNVLFGGGITNRPFLKDLLPLNLSELVFTDTPSTNDKENEVDPKKLRAQLGLAEDAPDADVEARLGLIKQFAEAFPSGPPKVDPPVDPTKTDPPKADPPTFQFDEDIRAIAAQSPKVKALLSFVESTVQLNAAAQRKLVEQDVETQLSEFDRSKLVLTPVAQNQIKHVMLHEQMTPELRELLWPILRGMRDQHKFFVELGERGTSATFQRTLSSGTATEKFEAMILQLMEGPEKLSYADAADRISGENRDLYEGYRSESIAFVE